jgi:hypothetical protein
MTARNFALIIGIIYVIAGVAGFVPPLMGRVPADAPQVGVTAFYGAVLGLFPANILHHLVHLAIGAWGIAAARSMSGARSFSKALAVIYAVLGVMGLIPGLNTMFGLVPLFGHDVWLHLGTALVAAYFGWFSRAADTTAKAAMR